MREDDPRDQTGDGALTGFPCALIISDMYFQAAGLVQQMEALGWRAAIAPRGDDLNDLFRRSHFDLVVLDADLGLGTVAVLAQSVRERAPACAVGALTGWWDARTDDLRALTDTVICKPPHLEQLRVALGRCQQHGPELPPALAQPAALRLNTA